MAAIVLKRNGSVAESRRCRFELGYWAAKTLAPQRTVEPLRVVAPQSTVELEGSPAPHRTVEPLRSLAPQRTVAASGVPAPQRTVLPQSEL